MRFLPFERRWIRGSMEAFLPPGGSGLTLAAGEADYVGAAETFGTHANLRGALGLRLAVWLVALSPVFLLGRFCAIDSLELAVRSELITRLLSHPVYPVRGLSLLIKVAASFAIFAAPGVRARSGYDKPSTATQRAARRALPVVSSDERKVA